MTKRIRDIAITVAALAAIAVGASAVAGAATDNNSSSSSGSTSGAATQSQTPPDPTKAHHPGEELLTGDTAAKVKAAAEAKVPGATVERVETDAEGSPYEAHVRKSDGSEVTVKVDKDFKVTGVEEGHGRGGPGDHDGPPPSGGSGSGSSTQPGAYIQ